MGATGFSSARNGDKNGRKLEFGLILEMGENGLEMEKMARKWLQHGISGHFPIFWSIFPHFVAEARFQFSAIFVPISGRIPKWICTRSTGFQDRVFFGGAATSLKLREFAATLCSETGSQQRCATKRLGSPLVCKHRVCCNLTIAI